MNILQDVSKCELHTTQHLMQTTYSMSELITFLMYRRYYHCDLCFYHIKKRKNTFSVRVFAFNIRKK